VGFKGIFFEAVDLEIFKNEEWCSRPGYNIRTNTNSIQKREKIVN